MHWHGVYIVKGLVFLNFVLLEYQKLHLYHVQYLSLRSLLRNGCSACKVTSD